MKQVDYDNIAEDYRSLEEDHPIKRGVINYWMLRFCGDVRGKRVLDLGCGSGFFTRAIASAGASEVVGIDISEKELEIGRSEEEKHPRGISYLKGDLGKYDYSRLGKFDLIVSSVALHYARDSSELERFISSPSKLLCSGGKFVATFIHPENVVGDWPTEKKKFDEIQDSDGKRVIVSLHDLQGAKVVEFINYAYGRDIYGGILKKNGYGNVEWFGLVPPKETVMRFPGMDWTKNISQPTLILLSAKKI